MTEVWVGVLSLVSYFGSMALILYLVLAFMNARSGVRHYEDLVYSYEDFVRFWRDKDKRQHDEVLATLIKHRRSLKYARRFSWPFPISSDQSVIEGATEEERLVS